MSTRGYGSERNAITLASDADKRNESVAKRVIVDTPTTLVTWIEYTTRIGGERGVNALPIDGLYPQDETV